VVESRFYLSIIDDQCHRLVLEGGSFDDGRFGGGRKGWGLGSRIVDKSK
jgi:hypothetical protein